jgi:hypothetical protein
MKMRMGFWVLVCTLLASCLVLLAQEKPSAQETRQTVARTATDSKNLNIEEYVELLRKGNVWDEKAQLLGSVLQLSKDEAAKFWPIFYEYNAELTKLQESMRANIEVYTREYSQLTDEKADQVIKAALDHRKKQNELLARYYERVKQALGAVTAARFLEIEQQLLLIIELQLLSDLPVVG